MAHPSDIGPVLVALKAKAIIVSANGERKVPMEDFFLGPNNFTETILKSDEFVTADTSAQPELHHPSVVLETTDKALR